MPIALFDTHTHLDYLQAQTQQPLAQLIAEALANNVQRILVVAVMAGDFQKIEQMTALYPEHLCYGLGLHPLHLLQHSPTDLELLDKHLALRTANCCAVAEIGLERGIAELIRPENWRKQCDLLEAQLQLAKKYQLPVSLHARKAMEALVPFLKKADLRQTGAVHGFSGSYEQAKRLVDLGYKIGVGGTISYQRANKTRATIAKLPLDCLLLETDSPDMPLFGYQGQPNRPARLWDIFQVLCQLRPESPEQIAQTLWQTSQLFAPRLGD